MLRPCSRENEVRELVERGQWPQACAPELRAHVESCRSCADHILITAAFRTARAEAVANVTLPPPGVLWWRAQLRRRNTAVERIGRPILGAQIFALAVNLVLAIAFTAWQARHGLAWLSWFSPPAGPAQGQQTVFHLDALWSPQLLSSGLNSMMNPLVLVPAIATLVMLGGVVVYLASEKQ
jgi:hypothetical protein